MILTMLVSDFCPRRRRSSCHQLVTHFVKELLARHVPIYLGAKVDGLVVEPLGLPGPPAQPFLIGLPVFVCPHNRQWTS
jgi:hypothetical protein